MPVYSVERTLGSGAEGTIFLVKNKMGNKFAMKAYTRCEEKQFKLEGEFNKEVIKKHPARFMRIIQADNVSVSDKDLQYLQKGTCRLVIYELIEWSLGSIIRTLHREAIYSIILQILDAINIMHDAGYIHSDLHMGNIGVIFTDNEKIKLSDGTRISTHGYQVKIIDYGFLSRTIDVKTKRKNLYVNYESAWVLHSIICPWVGDIWKDIHNRELEPKNFQDKDIIKGYEHILSQFSRDKTNATFLMRVLFPHAYFNRVFGTHYPQRKLKTTLPVEDLLFVLKADKNQELLIDYFRYRLAEYDF